MKQELPIAELEQSAGDSTRMKPEEGFTLVRRRRLILEEESEEEFYVQEVPSPSPPIQPDVEIPVAGVKARGRLATVSAISRSRAARGKRSKLKGDHSHGSLRMTVRSASQHKLRTLAAKGTSIEAAKGQGRVTGKKGRGGETLAPVVEGSEGDGEGKEAATLASSPRAPPAEEKIPVVVGLEDPDSEEETHPFELRRRHPQETKKLQRLAQSTRVSQVVQAFESGLAMADLEPKPNLGKPKPIGGTTGQELETLVEETNAFDEYGSNLSDPKVGVRKRQIEAMEGDMAESPTPKRQFIEDAAEVESVEEASREWPQPDK
ncbi:unnamed protein product [Linum trigynum]|uniref:Uncharacterized protein n=1 Tax=Linum trigynum TaxID=586398 RepID=A0AAV2D8X6_9ROSI